MLSIVIKGKFVNMDIINKVLVFAYTRLFISVCK